MQDLFQPKHQTVKPDSDVRIHVCVCLCKQIFLIIFGPRIIPVEKFSKYMVTNYMSYHDILCQNIWPYIYSDILAWNKGNHRFI